MFLNPRSIKFALKANAAAADATDWGIAMVLFLPGARAFLACAPSFDLAAVQAGSKILCPSGVLGEASPLYKQKSHGPKATASLWLDESSETTPGSDKPLRWCPRESSRLH
jgi:hypothetical protein